MSTDIPIPLTGQTSIYPYGVDTFTFMHNYQNWDDSMAGDVISAAFRNRIADSVIRLEQDLLAAAHCDTGDMRISAMTGVVPAVKINTNYFVPIPSDVLSFICYDGALLSDPSTQVVYLFGARPANAAKLAIWASSANAMTSFPNILNMIGATNTVGFQVWDRDGSIAANPNYAGSLGDLIISVILMRRK